MLRLARIGAIDQSLWALSNLLVVLSLAHLTTNSAFGLFGVVLGVLLIHSGMVLARTVEGLSVAEGAARLSGIMNAEVHLARRRAWGGVIVGALFAPMAVAAVGLLLRGDVAPQMYLWVVAAAPFAVMAEGARGWLYALRLAGRPAFVSVAWIAVQSAAVLLLGWTPDGVLAAWFLGAVAAAAVGALLVAEKPSWGRAGRDEKRRRRAFALEYVSTAGVTQLTVLIAGAAIGLGAAGALRAVQTVFGPLNIVVVGIRNALVPVAAAQADLDVVRRLGVKVAVATASMSVLAALVFVLSPALGTFVMGDVWPREPSFISAYASGRVGLCVTLGALVVLRAIDRSELTWRLRLSSSAAMMIPFVLALPHSLTLALWAGGAGTIVLSVVWWWVAWRSRRREGR